MYALQSNSSSDTSPSFVRIHIWKYSKHVRVSAFPCSLWIQPKTILRTDKLIFERSVKHLS